HYSDFPLLGVTIGRYDHTWLALGFVDGVTQPLEASPNSVDGRGSPDRAWLLVLVLGIGLGLGLDGRRRKSRLGLNRPSAPAGGIGPQPGEQVNGESELQAARPERPDSHFSYDSPYSDSFDASLASGVSHGFYDPFSFHRQRPQAREARVPGRVAVSSD